MRWHLASFRNNPATGYYEKLPSMLSIQKVPFLLKVERTQVKKIRENGADHVLVSKKVKGRYSFFTGLIPAGYPNWYFGNISEMKNGQKIISLIIVHFKENSSLMDLYLFNGFYISGRESRRNKVDGFIQSVIKKGGAGTPPQ